MGTIGASAGSGSGGGGTAGGTVVGNVNNLLQGALNPKLIRPKGRHQRGNSDGIQNIANRLFTHHTRGSSGSNGQLKTLEENLEAGAALLSQTLDLVQEGNPANSRTMAQAFANFHPPFHQKTNSSDTHDTFESQQLSKMFKQMEGATGSKQYLVPTNGGNQTIP